MTVPTENQYQLFANEYATVPDTTTQVARLPGTPDAPCLCEEEPRCLFPFCAYPNQPELEDE